MATTTAKCEFMDNAFPAGQLKLSGDFYVVEDDRGEHMIFSADQKGRLCLILKGEGGHNQWINLSEKFGLSSDQTISAFAVSQNRDGKIHLVFAARQNNGLDKLYVLRPKAATNLNWTGEFNLPNDFYVGEQWNLTVRQILLGSSNDSSDDATQYPQIHLVFKLQDKATEDIWAISVSNENRAWTNQRNFQMPCNADLIVDKCVANLKLYRGLFVLYKGSMDAPFATNLRFVGLNPTKKNPTLQTIVQKLPEGACRIASFDNSAGYTDLLISGKGLTWRSSQQCFVGSKDPFTMLNDDAAVSDLSQMRVAQTPESLSVWALGKDTLLAYQEFAIADDSAPTAKTPAIPLMNQDSGSDRFTALQHPKIGQKLFVIDKAGAMKMLEQDYRSAMWQAPIDVMIPDSKEMVEFKSHTVQIQVADEQAQTLLPKKELKLYCSTTAELLINGTSARGSPNGQTVTTDESGTLTVIIKADSLSAPLLTLTNTNSKDNFLQGPPLVIDPMSKVWSSVGGLKTKDDLKNMTLPDGSRFIKAGINDSQLEKAVQALQDLSKVKQDIAVSAQGGSSNATAPVSWAEKVGDRLWGAWFWIKEKVKEGWNWVVKKVAKAWEFIVEIAGKVWKFVLENFPQVAAAIQSVLEAISQGWDWVKKKFEFLFSWGDILDVKNIFANLTTQGLLWGVDAVALLEMQVDEYFEDLRAKVRTMKNKRLPKEMLNMKAGNDPELERQAKAERGESQVDETMKSPAASYGTYHLKHSGGNAPDGSGSSPTERLLKRMGDVFTQMETLGTRCQKNVEELFKSQNVTVDGIFQTLGVDLLEDVIGVIQKVVVGVLGSISDLILILADGINKAINIPILSPLYKKLTGGADLTILDVVCLCLAIPATLVYKLITGKKPSEIEGVGDLIKLNAMKPELDQRMGRVKIDALAAAGGDPGNPNISMLAMNTDISDPVGAMARRAVKEISAEAKEVIKKAQKRFVQSGLTVSFLLKIGIPAGAQLWYSVITWPKQMVPPTPYSWKSAMLSTLGKLVPWVGSFFSLFSFTKDEFRTRDVDIDKRFNDHWFNHRFRLWALGIVPVIGAMAGKQAGYVFQLTTSVAQAGLLLWLQIESWVDGPGYSVYLAVEEWAKLSGKLSSAISGLTLGGGFVIAPIALALTTIGSSMNIIRVDLENAGKRDILTTGMDVD